MHRRRTATALAAALTLALVPAAAEAKSPPKGDYVCTFYTPSVGTQYAGTLNIRSKTKYSVNDGKKYKYTTKGKKIRFPKGDYKGLYFGKWKRASGTPVIKIYGVKDKEEYLTCTRNEKKK